MLAFLRAAARMGARSAARTGSVAARTAARSSRGLAGAAERSVARRAPVSTFVERAPKAPVAVRVQKQVRQSTQLLRERFSKHPLNRYNAQYSTKGHNLYSMSKPDTAMPRRETVFSMEKELGPAPKPKSLAGSRSSSSGSSLGSLGELESIEPLPKSLGKGKGKAPVRQVNLEALANEPPPVAAAGRPPIMPTDALETLPRSVNKGKAPVRTVNLEALAKEPPPAQAITRAPVIPGSTATRVANVPGSVRLNEGRGLMSDTELSRGGLGKHSGFDSTRPGSVKQIAGDLNAGGSTSLKQAGRFNPEGTFNAGRLRAGSTSTVKQTGGRARAASDATIRPPKRTATEALDARPTAASTPRPTSSASAALGGDVAAAETNSLMSGAAQQVPKKSKLSKLGDLTTGLFALNLLADGLSGGGGKQQSDQVYQPNVTVVNNNNVAPTYNGPVEPQEPKDYYVKPQDPATQAYRPPWWPDD